ncbi:MAG TPA: CHAT domain-containing protein [Terriglobales bacterium]|nr:CHAT domain-containing protein [Terriglobales bacterium]
MPRAGKEHRRVDRRKSLAGGRALRALLLAFVVGSLPGCSRRDPQAAFDHARQTLREGDAVAAALEAEKGYEDFSASGPEWAWRFTILKAWALHSRGLDDQVLKLLSSDLVPPPIGELSVQKLRWEGIAYASLHKFPDAEQKFGEAERICAGSGYPACADVVDAQGRLEMERGHYAKAQGFFESVLSSARASGDPLWEADALLALSWSADEQTHFDEALNWADAARRISLARHFGSVVQTALGNMGWAYYKLGDSEQALEMFVEATKQAEKLGDTSDQVKWLTNAGYIDLDAAKFTIAEQSFQQSLKLAKQINSREDIINSLIALAFVSELTAKLEDAKRYADEALSMARADGNKRDEVYPRLVQGQVAAQEHDAAAAETTFREVAQSADSPVFLKWEAERSLARLYEDENQADSAEREYRTALTTFETARSGLQHEDSRLPFLSNASRIYDDYVHFLISRGKTNQALQVADYSRARTLSDGLGLLPKGTSFAPDLLNTQQAAKRAGGAILFYWLGEKQSYLWAITSQKTSLFVLPPAAEIDAAVQRYRKALVGPQDVLETANADGTALYAMLISPAQRLLMKDAQVFIIPDGSLNSLNFETLLVPGPKPHYWIEDATIADANSLRLLAASHNSTNSDAGKLLLIGDAISPNADYAELPKAGIEIEDIEKHFAPAGREVLTRAQATAPAYLESDPEQFTYIHFVAHGTASRLSPLDSAVILSKASAQEDSFKLYARDIIHHPLHAQLVTISTCYGAGARAYTGEGLVGLSWAFLRAGAHNVIGALWEVSDASTPRLMDELYDELKKGRSPQAALRSAKLSLLHSDGFSKPFYWAPFQLYTGT